MIDLHCHTNNSFDSNATVDDMVLSAIEKGCKIIAFTEHYSSDKNKKTYGHFNNAKFQMEILNCKKRYSTKIKILKGLEICEPHLAPLTTVDKSTLDFILGSVHNINNIGLRKIASINDNFNTYKIYFEEYLKMVTIGDFTVAAHLDLMNRYAFDNLGNYNFYNYKYLITTILITLIKRNKALEVNTSGLRKSINNFHPNIEVLKLYKELGGYLITIGSDSHNNNDILADVNSTLKILKSIGFETIYSFENFKPIKHYISDLI